MIAFKGSVAACMRKDHGVQASMDDSGLDSAGTGLAEQSVRAVKGKMRIFLHAIFASLNNPLEGDAADMCWLATLDVSVCHALAAVAELGAPELRSQ